jgi:hypothetical protein
MPVAEPGHDHVTWVAEPATRGTVSLLISCVSTTLVCTWSALHLNTPALGKTAWELLVRKIHYFLLAIAAPEYFVACAIREWSQARRVTATMQDILGVSKYTQGDIFRYPIDL